MNLSIVIPFYNEEEQVRITLATVEEVIAPLCAAYEFVAVDDGSKDKTWDILAAAAKTNPHIHAIRFSRNFGKEAALCAGLEAAKGDVVITMDGDLQHPPRYIPQMLDLWREGYDVVEGVKTSRGRESKAKKFFAKSFYRGFYNLSHVDLDNASDFKLLDREVVDAWNELGEHNTFFRGLSAWLGFKRYEMPFAVDDRLHGESKWSMRGLWNLAINAMTSFSIAPLALITWLGAFFLILALVIGIITLVKYFNGTALEGFTTVILLILIVGGAIMLSLGLIGTYIGKIYEEVKGRPRYLTMEELNPQPFEQLDDKESNSQKTQTGEA